MKLIQLFFILFFFPFATFSQDKKDLSKENPGNTKGAEANDLAIKDKSSKMDRFNAKAEKLFVYVPVPIISYTQETGNTVGLAKFNMINFYKDDTITSPSKFSALATFSSLGNIKLVGGWKIYFKNDKYLTSGIIGYRFFPEYILGTGNQPDRNNLEQIENTAYVVDLAFAKQIIPNNFFGIGYDFRNYTKIEKAPDSYLNQDGVIGGDGGKSAGVSFFYIFDNRKNRYTPSNGAFLELKTKINSSTFGSDFSYTDFSIDARKYFKVFNNHVIAIQGFWGTQAGDIPYFDLYKMGGDSRMRGYYLGAIRDENIIDAQVEYRLPIWSIFGMTGWVGQGKVYSNEENFNLKNLWGSYGLGLRIMVDSKSQTNLRFDVGFNQYGSHAFIINFSEAF